MRITILTTIGNPEERQDKWRKALKCYDDLADEIVIVDGSKKEFPEIYPNKGETWYTKEYFEILEKLKLKSEIKCVFIFWPYKWNWIQLPKSLNAGLEKSTGSWIIKLDIDQFIHEKDFASVRDKLEYCPKEIDVLTFQKMSMTYGKKYYQKGPTPIAFRRKDYIKIGKDKNKETDLCFPIHFKEYEKVGGYKLPVGVGLNTGKTGITVWNYDNFFKTEDFVRNEFWRFSKAYHKYFKKWSFGSTKERAFKKFLNMMKGRHDRCPYTYKLKDHPKYIRDAVKNLKSDMFGYNAWGKLDG